ncbi:hypothetical protein [Marivita sp. XM-24bin2]|jgi:uncharacterized protein YjiS (DUF1127 family)|uniref:hypothetical protein n=1 Tax=unclassified Marivita TaxID=2632480 RepID=UPI0025C6F6A9|nr:hypothetical protein [Marivita sp. XM-24bin2]MCR9108619.1 hypothetical protein [Paracoccaceae bacterium]
MTRILTRTRDCRPRSSYLATLLQRIGHMARMIGDARRLETLPRDRLDDMGISPRTAANCRSSGESGPIPRGPTW